MTEETDDAERRAIALQEAEELAAGQLAAVSEWERAAAMSIPILH